MRDVQNTLHLPRYSYPETAAGTQMVPAPTVSTGTRISSSREIDMNSHSKPTHSQGDGFTEDNEEVETETVNDALGTVSEADSTGLDDEKETGEARDKNFNTHED